MNNSRWRTNGDPAMPGHKLSAPRAKTRAPHDITYGDEPDMLNVPGLMVEPDIRRKIAKYFKTMKLREVIGEMILESNKDRALIHDVPVTFTFEEEDERPDSKRN